MLDVALAHHLVSRYTSLVAVDVTPARPTGGLEHEPQQAVNGTLTNNQTDLATLPKTATSGQLHMLLGLSAFVLAGWLWRCQQEHT